jgi:hypothetical protein
MEDIYVYLVQLPDGVKEMVAPCSNGYTVYIDARLDEAQRLKEYYHALRHIKDDDHSKEDVQEIEHAAHKTV